MTKLGQISRFTGFIMSMIFSTAVIFMCSYGIIGIFQTLSTYSLDDLQQLSSQGADGVVAAVTGIDIDETELENELVGTVKEIVYNFDEKENYTFNDAMTDAKTVLSKVVNSQTMNSSLEKVQTSIEQLFSNSSESDSLTAYVDDYLHKIE